MKSLVKTLLFAGLASGVCGAALGMGIAKAETVPPPGTLDAQYAALYGAPPSAPAPRAEAPAGPASVGLAHRLVDAAAAYASYMRQAVGVDAAFKDGASVAAAVQLGASYQGGQLEEGATAYAALVALQDPLFVQGVRDWAATAPGEASPGERLLADPARVLETPGAPRAVAVASAALRRQGEAVLAAGKAVKQAAYDVQHQAWSSLRVPDPEARLADVKARSAVLFRPTDADVDALLTSAVAFRREQGDAAPPPAALTPTVARALTVAALAVLGAAGEEQAERLVPLLTEPKTSNCVKMSKLNLNQCMAVAGPEYEDVFCLGQHALIDTGQCVIKAAGLPAPPPAPVQLAEASAPPLRSVMVPIAYVAEAAPTRLASAPTGPTR